MEIIINEVNVPYKDLIEYKETMTCLNNSTLAPIELIGRQWLQGKIILTFQSNGDFSGFINKNGDVKRKKLAKHILNRMPKRIAL